MNHRNMVVPAMGSEFHRPMRGAWSFRPRPLLPEGDHGVTPPAATASSAVAPAGAPAATDPPKPGDDGKGGKSAVLADLATERDKRQALEKTVADMQAAQKAQAEALAKALGVKPDEGEKPDALTAQITALQEQFATAQRRTQILELAAEHEIPKDYQHLLTATEPEALAAQAKSVGELVKGKAAAEGTPAFQVNPGQGQAGGGASSAFDAQIAEAEKARNFPLAIALKQQRAAELASKH